MRNIARPQPCLCFSSGSGEKLAPASASELLSEGTGIGDVSVSKQDRVLGALSFICVLGEIRDIDILNSEEKTISHRQIAQYRAQLVLLPSGIRRCLHEAFCKADLNRIGKQRRYARVVACKRRQRSSPLLLH